MSVIRKISLKNRLDADVVYDIGANVDNIIYDGDLSLKEVLNVRYHNNKLQTLDYINNTWIDKIQVNDAVYYVNKVTGHDSNVGDASNPFATISKAVNAVGPNAFTAQTATIYIADGEYNEDINVVGKNINFTGINGASANITIKGTFTVSNFAKVYMNSIKFDLSDPNVLGTKALVAKDNAYIINAGTLTILGNGSNTACYAYDNGTIHINQAALTNIKCGFLADAGTIRVFGTPTFSFVVTGASVTNGGVIHLRNKITNTGSSTVTTPYDTSAAYGGRIFSGDVDVMEGSSASKDGASGTVPKPLMADREKFLKGDGTWTAIDSSGDAITNITRDSNSLTFTATRKNGTTFTFTQKDDNTWTALKGATSSAAGTAGYTPAPAKGYQNYWLAGDATWHTAQNMRNNMGLGDTTGVLQVSYGGTGNNSGYIRAGRKSGSTIGSLATAEGYEVIASGMYSHAEGYYTTAGGSDSHAEGSDTKASGEYAHAEGLDTIASGNGSHAEGSATTASKNYSHAEGSDTKASGDSSHAEGSTTTASGNYSHAEGYSTKATTGYCHAEGWSTIASGSSSHAEGRYTQASGDFSHAGGNYTIANQAYQTAIGTYNKSSSDSKDLFIIGCGISSSSRKNLFRVNTSGGTYLGAGSYNGSGADYAELFEWKDGNPTKEDRRGLFVTLDGDKIVKAKLDDFILGIVSAAPAVLGNSSDEDWVYKYKRDIFGKYLYEEVEVPEEKDAEGNVIRPAHKEDRLILNPDFKEDKEYIPRSERPEWDAVGMLGKLVMVDDGTCKVNGWCKSDNSGRATKSDEITKFRVLKRLDENHIQVLIL